MDKRPIPRCKRVDCETAVYAFGLCWKHYKDSVELKAIRAQPSK